MRRILIWMLVIVGLVAGATAMPEIEVTLGGGEATVSPAPAGESAVGATPTFDLPADGARGGSGDDYPWKHLAKDSGYDRWGMSIRNCTSWVAWALHSRNGFEMPFHDHAKNWGPRARALGFVVDGRPAVGAVAWSPTGEYGHVAWVTEVSGGTVWVEEYNQRNDGAYGRRALDGGYEYLHFRDLPAPVAPTLAAPAPSKVVVAAPAPTTKITATDDPDRSPNLQPAASPQPTPTPPQGSTPALQESDSPQDVGGGAQRTESSQGAGSTTTTSTSTTSTTAPAPPNRRLTVSNLVTNGSSSMREDTPAYLSTRTTNYCKRYGCALANTDMASGHAVTAYCAIQGSSTTNGEDGDARDDANPGLYTSTLWFGIRWPDSRTGYLSEVWIAAGDRGQRNLPAC